MLTLRSPFLAGRGLGGRSNEEEHIVKLAELTWPDLEQVSRDAVVVYPIAAFEQHGPHLPFITDTAEVAAIVDRLDAEISRSGPLSPSAVAGLFPAPPAV